MMKRIQSDNGKEHEITEFQTFFDKKRVLVDSSLYNSMIVSPLYPTASKSELRCSGRSVSDFK